MGRIAEVVATERDENGALNVRCDPGGGAIVTAEHFGDSGDDSCPLPGDSVALEPSAGSGAEQATGYHDPKNAGVAEPGEHRRYSRDEDGEIVAYLWLKKDGTAELKTLNGAPLRLVTTGPVILDSPDVRLSDAAGAQVARVGDLVAGAVNALSTAPGSPIAPNPAPAPGVPFVGQIVSGSSKVKA